MMLRTLALLTAVGLGAAVFAAPAAFAGDPAVQTRSAELDAILLAQGRPLERAKAVHVLAELNTAEAARALLERLDTLAARKAKLEEQHERTKIEFQPYEGFEFTDPKAWDIKKRLREELDAQSDVLVADSVVLRAFATAVNTFSDRDALTSLERSAPVAPQVHARMALYRGLLTNALIDATVLGEKGMKDKDAPVRLVVLEVLADRKDPGTLKLGLRALKEVGWPLREAAARLLAALGSPEAIAPLVNAMATDEGHMLEVYAEALTALTGEKIGAFPGTWKAWYDEHKAQLAEQGAKPQATKRAREGATAGINYYGIETISRRIVFLIDISGSMNEVIGDPDKQDVTGQQDGSYSGKKIDIAKSVLKQAIRNLPDEAFFNIVIFNHEVRLFEEAAVQATQENKNKAYLAIGDLKASGSTFTYGALEKLFGLAGRGLTDKAYDPGVDTVFVLSDGAPTTGDAEKAEPMDAEKILNAVAEWNSLKRLVIHTIAIDPRIGRGSFVRFMKGLAHQNRGTYTEIGGDGKKH